MKSERRNWLSHITDWLKEARQVTTGHALAAVGVVAVIAIGAFLAFRLGAISLEGWQALLLFGLMILAVPVLVLLGSRKSEISKADTGKPDTGPIRPLPLPPTEPIGYPKQGKPGVLIDLSHDQGKWRTGSIFDLVLQENRLVSLILPASEEVSWDLRAIKEDRQFRLDDLVPWRGVLLGIPYHKLVSQQTVDTIVSWVRQGGRLVMLGYELGERHHRTNINRLGEEFGLRFNSDIVAPEGHDPVAKPYGREVEFSIAGPNAHPVVKGIHRLCMKNVCTLTVEPGSSTLVPIGGNGVSRESSPNYTDGWTSSGSQRFELLKFPKWFPVVAEAPIGLTGKGRVIAVGTWDFFGTDNCYRSHDNYLFVRNLLKWLSASD